MAVSLEDAAEAVPIIKTPCYSALREKRTKGIHKVNTRVPFHIHQNEHLLTSLVSPAAQFSQLGFQGFVMEGLSPWAAAAVLGKLGGHTRVLQGAGLSLESLCRALAWSGAALGSSSQNAGGHHLMLLLLSRSPATHECFVGDLKLLLNRFYFFKIPQKQALSPSICSTPSYLSLSILAQNFVFMQSLVCPHGCVGRKAPAHWVDAQQEEAGRAVVPLIDLPLHRQPLHPSAHQPRHPSGHHSCLGLQHPLCR